MLRKWIVAAWILVSLSCAPVSRVAIPQAVPPAQLTLIHQQGKYDCVIAALAMASGAKYETVDDLLVIRHWNVSSRHGVPPDLISTLAEALNTHPKPAELWQADDIKSDGLLIVMWPWGEYHCVVVSGGWVYDPAEDRPLAWPEALSRYAPIWIIHTSK